MLGAFFIPAVTARPYDPRYTSDLVREVLQTPVVNTVPGLLPVAKVALFVAALLPLLRGRWMSRALVGYYAIILIVVAFGQNVAQTPTFGWAWLVGNTVVQLVVALWCIRDLLAGRTTIGADLLQRSRLWLLVPMALALLMPYAVEAGRVVPGGTSVLVNEAGVTYCMITPVVLGAMLLCPGGADGRTLSMASYVGLIFGVLNLGIWFGLNPEDSWMGVLHLPLVVTSVFGLYDARLRADRVASVARDQASSL